MSPTEEDSENLEEGQPKDSELSDEEMDEKIGKETGENSESDEENPKTKGIIKRKRKTKKTKEATDEKTKQPKKFQIEKENEKNKKSKESKENKENIDNKEDNNEDGSTTKKDKQSSEEREKEFHLDSLIALEEEYEAGDIDETDYKRLKAKYEKEVVRINFAEKYAEKFEPESKEVLELLEKEKEFYKDSLKDLEEEYEAGDIDETDYKRLKAIYEKRVARANKGVSSPRQAKRAVPWYRLTYVWVIVFVAILGSATGVTVALTSGERSSSGEATGGVRESSQTLIGQAQERIQSAFAQNPPTPTQLKDALTLLEAALEDSPANVEALQLKAQAEIGLERFDEGRATFKEALALEPENLQTLLSLTLLENSQGFYKVAIEYLDMILDLNLPEATLGENAVPQILQNVHFQRLNAEYGQATLASYPESLGEGIVVPTSYADLELPSVDVGLGIVNEVFNQLQQLQQQLQQLQQQLSEQQLQQLQQQTQQSLILPTIILDLLVNDLDGLFLENEVDEKVGVLTSHATVVIGNTQDFPFRSPNNDKGFESLQRAIDLQPENIQLLLQRAELYRTNRAFDEALEDVDKAIELDPENIDARFLKVDTLQIAGRTDEAIAAADQAIADLPNSVDATLLKVAVLQANERWDEALELVTQAIADFPNNTQALVNRIFIYRELMNFDAAIEDVDSLLDIIDREIERISAIEQPSRQEQQELQTLNELKQQLPAFRQDLVARQTAATAPTTTTTTTTTTTMPEETTTTSAG